MILNCFHCDKKFQGRRDAKTCSDRCRIAKHRFLQVAQEAGIISDETGSIQVIEDDTVKSAPTNNKVLGITSNSTQIGTVVQPVQTREPATAAAPPAPTVAATPITNEKGADTIPVTPQPVSLEPNVSGLAGETLEGDSLEYGGDKSENLFKKIKSKISGTSWRLRLSALGAVLVITLLFIGGFSILTSTGEDKQEIAQEISVPSDELNFSQPAGSNLEPGSKLSINVPLVANNTIIITPTDKPASLELGQIYFDQDTKRLYIYDGTNTRNFAFADELNSQGAVRDGRDGRDGKDGTAGESGAESCPNGNCVSLQTSTPGVQETGNINISGAILAGSFTGDGAGLTNVDAVTLQGNSTSFFTNASNISSGTLDDGRLSANVTLQGNVFNGVSQLVQTNGSGELPALSGVNLTNLDWASLINYPAGCVAGQAVTAVGASLTCNGFATSSQFATAFVQDGNNFGGPATLGTNDSNPLVLETSDTPRITIESDGDVGIGTSGPGYRLDVSGGDINTTGIYRVGGAQISSANLSNDANLAKLNGIQTFTAANTFSSTVTIQGTGGLTLGSAGNIGGIIFHDGVSANVGTLQLAGTLAGNVDFKFPIATGTQTLCTIELGNCAGSGSGITGSGNTNRLAKFTGAQTIGDSSITDDGSVVTISVGQIIQGSGGLTLGVSNSVNGVLVFQNSGNANTFTLQSGATGSNLVFTLPTADGSSGNCLKTDGAGNLTFASCTGGAGGGVTSVNSLTGVLSLNGTANQVNVASGGSTITLSTPQDINTNSNVAFRTVALNGTAIGDNLIVANAISGATGKLLDLQVNSVSQLTVDASGNLDIIGQYRVGGSQISSANLSNDANLAKLNGTGPQIFTGNNRFNGTLLHQNASNSTSAFQILNDTGSTIVFNADTSNGRVGIGNGAPGYPLDVTGDVNTSGVYRINGVTICSSGGCSAGAGSGNYIQNGTTPQTADFNITGNGTAAIFNAVTGINTGAGAGIQRIDSSGNLVNIGSITGTSALSIASGSTAQNLALNGSTTGQVLVGGISTGDILLGGGSGSTGCTVTNSSGNFACTGNITGAVTGTVGYWSRSGTTVQPATAGDNITTSGNISTTGSGTLTSAGLLTGTLGTSISGAAINLNASSNFATNINTGTSTGAVTIGNTLSGLLTLSAGNAGIKVQPANSTSAFQIQNSAGTSNLFIADTTNTRIGIGLASPSYTLDVAGDINASGKVKEDGFDLVPTGSVISYTGTSAPSGWLMANGSCVADATYPGLRTLIASIYGDNCDSGAGANSGFLLPDIRGKNIIGYNSGDSDFNSLTDSGGSKTHTLTQAQLPSYNLSASLGVSASTTTFFQTISFTCCNGGGSITRVAFGGSAVGVTGTASGSIASGGSGQSHNILDPYVVLGYIIKY